jgi:branched-chain amino acid transport system substrate-binding protein
MNIARCFSRKHLALFAAGVLGVLPAQAQDQEVDSAAPIKLGMSTALTGPARDLGLNMKTGVDAAIAEINANGGLQGRMLELIALDDGYEPDRTAPNMHQLITEDQVLAVVGNVGTPTAVAAVPIANELKVPFYGAYTGAGVLRKAPPDRYVINYRASYGQETAAMVNALIEHAGLRPEEIAFFTQQDAYGDAGYEGGMIALRAQGLTDDSSVAHGRYRRNTIAIENALADIMQAPVECKAVIMVGAYAPCAEFIRLATEVGVDALFLNVSFVGAVPLADAIEGVDARVIVTQVVPPPSSDLGIVDQFRSALLTFDPHASPTHGALEGYLAMQILRTALSEIDGEISRESAINALEDLGEFELDAGIPLSLSPTDHQASDHVWATMIQEGQVVPLDWSRIEDWDAVAIEESYDE